MRLHPGVAELPGQRECPVVVVAGAGVVGQLLPHLPSPQRYPADRPGVTVLLHGGQGGGQQALGVAVGEAALGVVGRRHPGRAGRRPVAGGLLVDRHQLGPVRHQFGDPAVAAGPDRGRGGVVQDLVDDAVGEGQAVALGREEPGLRAPRSASRAARAGSRFCTRPSRSMSSVAPATAATRRNSSISSPARRMRSTTTSRSDRATSRASAARSVSAARRKASTENSTSPPVRR